MMHDNKCHPGNVQRLLWTRGRERIPHSALRSHNKIPGGRIEVEIIKLMESLSKWAWMGNRSWRQMGHGIGGLYRGSEARPTKGPVFPRKHSSSEKGGRRGGWSAPLFTGMAGVPSRTKEAHQLSAPTQRGSHATHSARAAPRVSLLPPSHLTGLPSACSFKWLIWR